MPFSELELSVGIADDQLRLFYQPLVSAHGFGLRGVEALVRWAHPERGLLGPDLFLPAMERKHLMGGLTNWVLCQALVQHAQWQRDGLSVPVSVNLSATLLDDPNLPEQVGHLLTEYRIRPQQLTLEVTETALVDHPDTAGATLTALRALGVRISIDDFGTGYTTLAMLKHYHFDEVKIDRSFVSELRHSPADEAIVRAILELGHRLGLEVVAEGVEDAWTARLLAELGCDVLQGYHFAKPAPAAGLSEFFDAKRHRTRPLVAMPGHDSGALRQDLPGSVPAALPVDEEARLAALAALGVMDTAADPVLDSLVAVAASICGTPTALMSLIDEDRQWFKARTGLDAIQTSRQDAFCAHAILQPGQLMEIPDALQDPRFATNPLVTGHPDIRFYAGAPLVTDDGFALGTLCVLDSTPHTLNDTQRQALHHLSQVAVRYLQATRAEQLLQRMLGVLNTLAGMQDLTDLDHAGTQIAIAARDMLTATGAALMLPETPGSVRYRARGFATEDPAGKAVFEDLVLDSRGDSTIGLIRSSRQPLFLPDAPTSPYVRPEPVQRLKIASCLYLPVLGTTGLLGMLAVWWTTPQPPPDHARTAALTVLATEVGATLSRLTATDTTQRAVDIDPLTGLLNRRAFLAAVTELPEYSTILLIGVNHLAALNAQQGHRYGDHLLKALAAHLRAASRACDITARWGGTTFALALGPTDTAGTTDLLRRLHTSWQQSAIPATLITSHITTTPNTPPETTLDQADHDLRHAKKAPAQNSPA